MFKKYQQIHMVGIGGIGMSGIAEVLLNLGYRVTGSDIKRGDATKRLARRGARVHIGHRRQNIDGAHAVVISSAVGEGNPEVREARRLGIAVVPRAEMLAELMRLKYGVAVAGAHGKTSTTSLIGHMLDRAGLDPTLIIGGKVNNLRSNARLGKGEYLVAEADESDGSFLKLAPTVGVITNIDREHMENYSGFEGLKRAFVEFANKVPFYGAVIACTANPVVRAIVPRITRPCITYGAKDSDYWASGIRQDGDRLTFTVMQRSEQLGEVTLGMIGTHQVENALAAIAVGLYLDIPFKTIRSSLLSFRGVARRFQVLTRKGPMVVDDYAHHPAEIQATICAARGGWPKKRLVAVLQPHRYSRLAYHFDRFVSCVKDADAVVVMDVYAAGERPRKNYNGGRLWRELCRRYPKKMVAFAPTTQEVLSTLAPWCRREDMILFLGAGSVTQTAKAFSKSLT
ncbi:MAG: UDP-N-acetylmuramate--L-alanine ligase [Proteobacteria bacterium]|nr:UDP-N-acetylmuramate--L-alanine ligase [Pseudomonadota bacterium]